MTKTHVLGFFRIVELSGFWFFEFIHALVMIYAVCLLDQGPWLKALGAWLMAKNEARGLDCDPRGPGLDWDLGPARLSESFLAMTHEL